MKDIPPEQVRRRLTTENPWWIAPHRVGDSYSAMPHRAYFQPLYDLLVRTDVKRATLLLGPRRVGKTVLIHHTIARLLTEGVAPQRICYVSVDHPLYNGRSLQELLDAFRETTGCDYEREPGFVFFDEIQYLRDWEKHLKALVDTYPRLRLAASGSAAAALRLKSNESGAGRFTEFLLPPLTFHEYLSLLGKTDLIIEQLGPHPTYAASDIGELNKQFVHYLNFGGYPEVVLSEQIQSDPGRYVKSDIIDKVLLRDLPSLYGIHDVQELNSLFTTLAYNTADEVSLEQLSKRSGVAKNTIKRYIEYLEAAFLVRVVHRIDRDAGRFQRATHFKVYLTNPSIRSALFAPITEDDEHVGPLAETAIFAQWFHLPDARLHYARWQSGEVDIVWVGPNLKPAWAVEVKWTDRYVDNPEELHSLLTFCRTNRVAEASVTTRTLTATRSVRGVELRFKPASVYCYALGQNILRRNRLGLPVVQPSDEKET